MFNSRIKNSRQLLILPRSLKIPTQLKLSDRKEVLSSLTTSRRQMGQDQNQIGVD